MELNEKIANFIVANLDEIKGKRQEGTVGSSYWYLSDIEQENERVYFTFHYVGEHYTRTVSLKSGGTAGWKVSNPKNKSMQVNFVLDVSAHFMDDIVVEADAYFGGLEEQYTYRIMNGDFEVSGHNREKRNNRFRSAVEHCFTCLERIIGQLAGLDEETEW
jgi:hypothetical protein